MIDRLKYTLSLLEQQTVPKEKVIVILGPTASGKTKLAVQLAQRIDAEIISGDSRQIYKRMDIGTGKDLSEYQDIPYHLIDTHEPGERYHLGNFIADFHQARQSILERGKHTILCGGTGLYIQSVIQQNPYALIPSIEGLKESLLPLPETELLKRLQEYTLPANFQIDLSTKKRIIRAIEILAFLDTHPDHIAQQQTVDSIVIGLNPSVEIRREHISQRLKQRLNDGLLAEVAKLLTEGITHDQLQYYGLEYKYASFHLLGQLDYPTFTKKLETEIHRYAKRQMTYFRKMEKDGIIIHWV
ncbi:MULTISPECIES: tRNA (adenosine(37)-N6)-dimethylallyltransferase MiaA [Sphingobacterium]|uniref:tRNA (adenosine(37)-N6)-dimethylallyltransferase MiaA n=1 Tax=Sphingobacterium TaxID=28453 RepID=UPI000AB11B6A|nr:MULTISPECIES: tRNA (adenosine(37)-N6)-dimethylallyltransferase MiaA [Sphingobacterium]HAE67040.1 tRNA (adenosine(37)-N6)-dimethylallyltransferase MiaA [Sphingobacterium sp.]HAF37091.1 tRNA (adenosine(37)-N6)-dimethylallyltransferase MiaA [Sphingobacterium sp.]HAK31475.1 tRNA (adenosine(37)-N6)-dimethylallyltransferase MiaA [Sphingobacterium sp.]HAL50863.1 tRNA (adenosine(37)-N6)-dimethylallyltransferase MiaA [Sphingobacterium sp.]HAU55528.1 tRNA (adenosine(37)-N6)-dimethylallyltransferase M